MTTTTTTSPTKTKLKNDSSRFLNKFAMISVHLVCVIWPNYPETDAVLLGLKSRKKNEIQSSCVLALYKNLKCGHQCNITLQFGSALLLVLCKHGKKVCQKVVYLSTTWAQIQTTARALTSRGNKRI